MFWLYKSQNCLNRLFPVSAPPLICVNRVTNWIPSSEKRAQWLRFLWQKEYSQGNVILIANVLSTAFLDKIKQASITVFLSLWFVCFLGFFFLSTLVFLPVCMYMYTTCMPSTHGGQHRVSDALELGLWMLWTWVLLKNKKCSWPLVYLKPQ